MKKIYSLLHEHNIVQDWFAFLNVLVKLESWGIEWSWGVEEVVSPFVLIQAGAW